MALSDFSIVRDSAREIRSIVCRSSFVAWLGMDEKTEWTKEATTRLIELFHAKAELWDATNRFYKDRQRKREAWLDVARSMGMERALVEKKMRSAIGQFQREERKMKSHSNSLTRNEFQSKWFAFPLLLFLKAQNKPHRSRGAFEEHSIFVAKTVPQSYVEGTRDKVTSRMSSDAKETECHSVKNADATHKRKLDTAERGVCNEHNCRQFEKDEYHFFGELISCKIRKLKTAYARSTVQHYIENILYRAALGQFDEPSQLGAYKSRQEYDHCDRNSGTSRRRDPEESPLPSRHD